MNSKTKKLLLAFVCLLAVALVIFLVTRPETFAGKKNITVTVVFADGSEKVHEVSTKGKFLYDAVKDFVTGEDGAYGFFITGVDGVEADSTKEEWWCLNDGNGEMLMTGVSETPIKDGDAFQIVLTVGYDY
ncbi:MAG: DUF4430 domain-containing protein [Oscillospiraceae bacterium]|nr:DUF4430 domain-containing protein [Oscillospiraceae bacterium]